MIEQMTEFLKDYNIEVDTLHPVQSNDAPVLVHIQYDDIHMHVEGCGRVILKQGFTNLIRTMGKIDCTLGEFKYDKDTETATVVLLPHTLLKKMYDHLTVLGEAFGEYNVVSEDSESENIAHTIAELQDKVEQCIYATLITDPDLKIALGNDGEFLSLYKEKNPTFFDRMSVNEDYEEYIQALDSLSLYY